MLDKLARRMIQPVNTSVISIMGVFNALLGLWLLLPFKSINERPAYNPPLELIIGLLTLIIGVGILVGSVKEKLSMLSITALTGFMFWFAVTGLVLFMNWRSPGWIFTIMIAFYHGFVGVNIRVNIKNLPNKKESFRM